jgi:hypothetical protein
MLTGYNSNVRHRGVLFHVQTEDSGREHPHIITHLYHRGTIIESLRSDYADRLGAVDLGAEVRAMMESQHKAMLLRLRRGEMDALIGERLGPAFCADDASGDVSTDLAETHPEPATAAPPAPEAPSSDAAPRAFGHGVLSGRPLDEVVLDYLVESARRRKRTPP